MKYPNPVSVKVPALVIPAKAGIQSSHPIMQVAAYPSHVIPAKAGIQSGDFVIQTPAESNYYSHSISTCRVFRTSVQPQRIRINECRNPVEPSGDAGRRVPQPRHSGESRNPVRRLRNTDSRRFKPDLSGLPYFGAAPTHQDQRMLLEGIHVLKRRAAPWNPPTSRGRNDGAINRCLSGVLERVMNPVAPQARPGRSGPWQLALS